jgi:hypothetical protein
MANKQFDYDRKAHPTQKHTWPGTAEAEEFEPKRFRQQGHFGQEIRSESCPERNSHDLDEHQAVLGMKENGGELDVSHSLSSAGDVHTYNEKGLKPRPTGGISNMTGHKGGVDNMTGRGKGKRSRSE